MKLSTFTQAVILMLLVAIAASCGTSHSVPGYPDRRDYPDNRYPDERRYPDSYPRDNRSTHRLPPGHEKKVYGNKSARSHAPGQRKKYGNRNYPLIINPGHNMHLSRTRDGRYYYRNSDGFYYWQGYDNRLYLDQQHLAQVEYNSYDYQDWKDRGRNNVNRYKNRRY